MKEKKKSVKMAVGFYLPDEDEHLNSSYQSAVMVSTTNNSATQTPLQSPVSREFLVQAFCEALHRCSITGEFFVRIFYFTFFGGHSRQESDSKWKKTWWMFWDRRFVRAWDVIFFGWHFQFFIGEFIQLRSFDGVLFSV